MHILKLSVHSNHALTITEEYEFQVPVLVPRGHESIDTCQLENKRKEKNLPSWE